VLLVHEWWGHNEYIQKRARDYAAQGYLAFAVDMYGADQQGVTVAEASALSKPFYDDRNLMRNRARAGLTAFISAAKEAGQHLDAHRISALGYCFGGTVALELARSGAPVRSTVVFHGGLGTPDRNLAKQIKGSILVLNGADDPMVPAEERNQFMQEMRDGGVDWQFVEYGGALHAFSNPAVDEKGIPGARYNKRADDRSFALSCAYLAEQLAG
jgi:dienelactone hydrolase